MKVKWEALRTFRHPVTGAIVRKGDKGEDNWDDIKGVSNLLRIKKETKKSLKSPPKDKAVKSSETK